MGLCVDVYIDGRGMREVSMTVISLCEYLTNGGKNETHQKVLSHRIMLWR